MLSPPDIESVCRNRVWYSDETDDRIYISDDLEGNATDVQYDNHLFYRSAKNPSRFTCLYEF
jgi:hypothetical protein